MKLIFENWRKYLNEREIKTKSTQVTHSSQKPGEDPSNYFGSDAIADAEGEPSSQSRGRQTTQGDETYTSSSYDKGGSSQERRIAATQYTGKKKRWKGKAIVHDKVFYQPNYAREADGTYIESITVGNRTLKPGTRAFEIAKKIVDEQEQTFAADAEAGADMASRHLDLE
jgi:hypothetical protein